MRLLIMCCLVLSANIAQACTKDTECKGDRICSVEIGQDAGRCVSPNAITKPSQTSSSLPAVHEDSAKPHVVSAPVAETRKSPRTFHLNILGVLQTGIAPTIEWGESSTFLLRARLMNSGVLTYILAEEEFVFGAGVGGQWRKYLGQGTQTGPYFGGGAELMYTNTEDRDGVYETYFLVPQFEGGVRWDAEGYFSALGAFMGAAIPINTGGYEDEEAETLVVGGLSWDIGFHF